MSTQVTNADGTETDLLEHLRDGHQKGIRGFTEEYLAKMHDILHQRTRDPLPEHTHPRDTLLGIPPQPGPAEP